MRLTHRVSKGTSQVSIRQRSVRPELTHVEPQFAPSSVVSNSSNSHRSLVLSILSAKPSQREAKLFAKQFVKASSTAKDSDSISNDVISVTQTNPLSSIKLGIVRIDAGLEQEDLDAFAQVLVSMQKLGLSPVVMIDFDSVSHPTHTAMHNVVNVSPTRRKRFTLSLNSAVPTKKRMLRSNAQNGRKSPKEATMDAMAAMHMRAHLISECSRVVEAIDSAGSRGVPIHSGVFSMASDASKGLDCDAAALLKHMGRHVPVLVPMAVNAESAKVAVFGTQRGLVSLAESFANTVLPGLAALPVKLFLINDKYGGIRLNDKSHVALVNLAEESTDLRARITHQETMDDRDHRTLKDLANASELLTILNKCSTSSSALIACVNAENPGNTLITNHLTDKPVHVGGGSALVDRVSKSSDPAPPTVLRTGLTLRVYDSLDSLDISRLESLLDASFGKKLDAATYFSRIRNCVSTIILAGDYDGAVIVTAEKYTSTHHPVYYLDKFAVHPQSQGLGAADILWKRMADLYPNLCWRSRTKNPVNKWYFERSDGNLKFGDDQYWMMFFYGRLGVGRLKEYRAVCEGIVASFI
ncbi:Amino-acid acetyltransferase, mitochondrial [Chytriomyces hyalinus]|nr:Amino-acid acetyltransferase, mitochondrial [Chytriomyces hyalinus]